MDAIKLRLLRIQQQLVGLNASQKMLVTSLIAIMVMTVLWWARYAGTAELEPVVSQSLTAEDAGQIQASLAGHGIEAKVVGDKVMVPADRKMEALALLTYDDKLPSKSANVWDDMLKQMSPWDPKSKTDSTLNHGRELLLAQVIKSYFPGVASAVVQINPTRERRIGESIEPGASVAITTKGRDVNEKKLSEAVAAMVAAPTAGLARKNVSVIINGTLRRASDPNDPNSGELLEQKTQWERFYADKLERQLPPGSVVTVEVKVDPTSSLEHRQEFDPSKSFSKERLIKTETQDTQQGSVSPPEPGAQPNTGLSLAQAAPSGGNSNTTEKSETEMENHVAKSEKTINTPSGSGIIQSVAANLPRSYFAAKAKKLVAGGKDPDEKAIVAQFEAEKEALRTAVIKSVHLQAADEVALTMYDDSSMPMLAGIGVADSGGAATPGVVSGMVGSHVKEIILGALAVISLFMVSTIVKKGAPPVVPVVKESGPAETPRLGADEAVAGIVGGDGNTTLDAMELDEGSIKAQQMVEQVSTMVKENPDAAANLVKRWLNRS